MMKASIAFIVVLGLAAVASANASTELGEDFVRVLFGKWMEQHGKTYESEAETVMRFGVFAENMKKIVAHNTMGHSYSLSMNQFGDLSGEEFKAQYLNPMLAQETLKSNRRQTVSFEGYTSVPDSKDWVAEGKVSEVKNQGQCGSCWAFSTTGALESAIAIKTGKMEELSEQQLVDCAGSFGNNGCNGGLMEFADEYIEANGLCTEDAYPYHASKAWRCHANSGRFSSGCSKVAYVQSYVDVTPYDEGALKAAVALQPVSIAIEADHLSFQFYSGGVYDGDCGTSLDHGVLLVGYGNEDGKDFWKIKNSWGTTWGENGYIRISRSNQKGSAGQCGLTESASYPIPCDDPTAKCA